MMGIVCVRNGAEFSLMVVCGHAGDWRDKLW